MFHTIRKFAQSQDCIVHSQNPETYSSAVAHQYTALVTLPDRTMPPMKADTAYQGYLPSCELHSRSLTVGHTGACDLRLRTRVTSPDCTHVVYTILRLPAQSQDSDCITQS